MYTDALEYLEEERDGWQPFEALLALTDEQLERPTDPAGPARGWSGRDLLAHMVAWQELALQAARELAVNQESPTIREDRQDWERDRHDALNARILEEWRALPLDEVRRRATNAAGELRGTLTVIPESRWLKHPTHMRYFEDTPDHYHEHTPELEAILAEAERAQA